MEQLTQFMQPALITIHLIGVAMGVGGAITTDATFLRSIWDRTITKGQLQLIEIISKVVVSGLVLLILSGLSLVALNPAYLSLSDGSQLFWVKMTIVGILTLNGVVFHKRILPILQRHQDKNLASEEVRSKLWLLASTGGLSGVSWFTVLILGKFMQVTDFSYLFIMNAYLLVVMGAIMSGYLGIYWILFSELRGKPLMTSNNDELPKKAKVPWLNRSLMAIVIIGTLVVGFIYASNSHSDSSYSDNSDKNSSSEQSTDSDGGNH